MGAVGNEFKQLLTRTKNSFMQSGVEITYFGNRKMYVTDSKVAQTHVKLEILDLFQKQIVH